MSEFIGRIKKLITPEIIAYFWCGLATTAVSWLSFWLLDEIAGLGYVLAEAISWALSTVFAFVVNKVIVFHSHKGGRALIAEFGTFTLTRVFSWVVETGLLALLIDGIGIPDPISKFFTTCVTTVLNYITSKLITFRKKKD